MELGAHAGFAGPVSHGPLHMTPQAGPLASGNHAAATWAANSRSPLKITKANQQLSVRGALCWNGGSSPYHTEPVFLALRSHSCARGPCGRGPYPWLKNSRLCETHRQNRRPWAPWPLCGHQRRPETPPIPPMSPWLALVPTKMTQSFEHFFQVSRPGHPTTL